jgi:co-chaperonin GroES (HSP10)
MDNIKVVEEIILGEFELLIEIKEQKTKAGIIVPDKNLKDNKLAYGVVAAKGAKVEDLEVGDIIVKTRAEGGPGFKHHDVDYVIISRHQVLIAVKPTNFDISDEISA